MTDPPPVQDVRLCSWCRCTLPVGHVCPAGAPVPCVQRDDNGETCGRCDPCYAAQTAWLAEHGTPGDLPDYLPEDPNHLEGPR